MASRFQRDSARNALFSSYDAQQTRSRPSSATPPTQKRQQQPQQSPYSTYHANNSSPYSLGGGVGVSDLGGHGPGFSAYPGSSPDVGARRSGDGGFRAATPNRKGEYSSAVMDELESQNEEQASEMSRKVKMLKELTVAIGDEIRDSTAFAEKMNEGFEGTRNRLRGTMNRMLRMAERTGVGWRVWLGFFAFVFLLFTYVWLF
ncbi:SNARE complex subunit [Teratosphaeria destructans]|uniref:SNARE complex subunit n=1 Tax=Teratosphaeria destructans TaxID=418781 RepID=A0A9W7SZ91_9PEZI|nr:SNARE complex subunit [Teratosphaeria destructans]